MKFNRYNVSNGQYKAKVYYSHGLSIRANKNMITLYEKGYNKDWAKVFSSWEDETDIMTDYFDDRKVRFYEGSKEYEEIKTLMKGWGLIK